MLVGRAAEVAAIEEALRASADGQLRAVLVTGEPGIGKSRLLAEAAAQTDAMGAHVLSGYALEGAPTAYGALRTALGGLAGDAAAREALADLLPVLAGAGLWPVQPGVSAPPLPPEHERARLFDTVAEALQRLSHDRPLVLLLDDLQWADSATWDLLGYLGAVLGGERLTLVLAARDEALTDTASPAARTVHLLNRARALTTLPLHRLDADAISAITQDVLGPQATGVATETLARLVARRSEGNPFFAEELLRDLATRSAIEASDDLAANGADDETRELPLTIRIAVGQRLGRLSDDPRELLRTASLVGTRWRTDIVASALDWPLARLDAAAAAAIASGVLAPITGGFRFTHDLIREALVESPEAERTTRHEALARAMEADTSRSDAGILSAAARHWERSGHPGQAARASLRAAHAALAERSWDVALEQASTAVRLAGPRPGGSALHLEALRTLSEAGMAAGHFASAEEALRHAVAAAAGLGLPVEEARARAQLAEALRRQERPAEAAAAFAVAIAHLRALPGLEGETARALAGAAILAGVTRHRYDEAETFAEEALSLAQPLGDHALVASASLALAAVRALGGRVLDARPQLHAALEQAQAAEHPVLVAEVHASFANSYVWSGEFHASKQAAEQRLAVARRAGDVFGLRHAHSWLALLALNFGEWDRATSLLDEAEPLLIGLDSPEPLAYLSFVRGHLAHRRGRLDEAEALLAQACSTASRSSHPMTRLE